MLVIRFGRLKVELILGPKLNGLQRFDGILIDSCFVTGDIFSIHQVSHRLPSAQVPL